MKIKIITAYWMGLENTKFQGAQPIRKQRYLGSLISHCINLPYPIICYTHQQNFDELCDIKKIYKLENLEIKIKELTEIKLHNEIDQVRRENFNKNLCGRGPEIMWGKFDVLENELENSEQVFWIDCGLQHPGIFPWRFSKKYFTVQDHPIKQDWWNDLEVYNFGKIFNQNLLNKIVDITKNKIIFLTSTSPQISYPIELVNEINNPIRTPYPIGGLFGGDVKIFKEYISKFWEIAKVALNNKILCTEEVIMKFAFDEMNYNKKINFNFATYYINEHDEFHFSNWNDNNKYPKPLYVIWHDILNY